MTRKKDVNCIVLCGGKGTRMQSETKHKVCFEIDGKPSILHTLGNFEKAGVNRSVVVVGFGPVTECVGPPARLLSTKRIKKERQRR